MGFLLQTWKLQGLSMHCLCYCLSIGRNEIVVTDGFCLIHQQENNLFTAEPVLFSSKNGEFAIYMLDWSIILYFVIRFKSFAKCSLHLHFFSTGSLIAENSKTLLGMICVPPLQER